MSQEAAAKLLKLDLELAYCGPLNLREVTITQIQNAFATNQISGEQLIATYLKRIKVLNPFLNAVIETNPDALKIAKDLDEERKLCGIRGPLHGIPILLKDNIGTLDKMETCAGSLALVGAKPKHDSEIAKRLRKAGAVILGKANMSEFANFRDPEIPNGWCGRGNQTHNAYILGEDPLGSSSGSAVAVAANLVTVSLGSETDGSLIAPASVASIVALKPTVGSISGSVVIPLAASQDSVGPMTRTVTDAALVYNAITTNPFKLKCFDIVNPDIACYLEKTFVVGVLRSPIWKIDEFQSTKTEKAIVALGLAGVVLKDPAEPEEGAFEKISSENEEYIMYCEFKSGLNHYLKHDVIRVHDTKGKHNKIHSLADVIKFNNENPTPEKYNQKILKQAEKTLGTSDPEYKEKRDCNISNARVAIDYVLKKYELDAILTPSDSSGKHFAAVAGYPIISVPVGFNLNGIPFGISFMGTANSEETLLMIANRFEDAYRGRHTTLFKK